MAKFTLLQMTQNVLSRIGSDTCNSVNDTEESTQVANIIQQKYYDIVTRGELPEHCVLTQLNSSGDASKPVLMTVPSGVVNIKWIKYFDSSPDDGVQTDQFGSYSHDLNVDIQTTGVFTTTSSTSNTIGTGSKTFAVASNSLPITINQGVLVVNGTNTMFGTVVSYIGTSLTINVQSIQGSGTFNSWVIRNATNPGVSGYKYVKMLPVEEFMYIINKYNVADSNTSSFTFTESGMNFTFYYKLTQQPRYCTIISNQYVIFDGFDESQDTTLQSSKTMVYAQIVPQFSMSDNFIPDIEDQDFPLLINEATSVAFVELKQSPSPKAEQEVKRQWSSVMRNKAISNKPLPFEELPNFGRLNYGNMFTSRYGTRWTRAFY